MRCHLPVRSHAMMSATHCGPLAQGGGSGLLLGCDLVCGHLARVVLRAGMRAWMRAMRCTRGCCLGQPAAAQEHGSGKQDVPTAFLLHSTLPTVLEECRWIIRQWGRLSRGIAFCQFSTPANTKKADDTSAFPHHPSERTALPHRRPPRHRPHPALCSLSGSAEHRYISHK
ncbi:hypothetical protein F0726_01084 [Acidithiobacillus caldus]|nr:hypothetical protein F0726_01084 [Acidithiobacillus caldus]